MSNPGVIKLAETRVGSEVFRVEDNIGEAVHIHYGNIRIDMTIKEFLAFADEVAAIMETMVAVPGFSFGNFDARFLLDACPHILALERVEFMDVPVETLKTDRVSETGEMEMVSIREARVTQALHGKTAENDARVQVNYWGETNDSRLKGAYDSIRHYGYAPEKFGNYIILMDDGRYIYDGCHRASCVLDIYGKQEVLVAMWHTKGAIYTDEKKLKELSMRNEEAEKRKRAVAKRRALVELIVRRDLVGKSVLIKGAGRHTEELLPILKMNSVKIVGITAESVKIPETCEIPFIPREKIRDTAADVILISSFCYRDEMRKEMEIYADQFDIYDIYEQGIEREFFHENFIIY